MGKLSPGRELGRGQSGTVTYLCTDTATQELFAVKCISKRALRTAEDRADVRREVAIMKRLPKHANIVSFKAAFHDAHGVSLVMELCDGGELFDHIVARGRYTESAAAALMRTIVETVRACHSHGIMHRDLKPENFLFANKSADAPLKLIDFGLSTFFRPGERFDELVGTLEYMAPEMWRRDYGPEVDLWSAGVILFVLLSGWCPFRAETAQATKQKILRGKLDFESNPWPRVSDSAKSLVRHLLEQNPRVRYNAQQVLNHPWLQNAESGA